MNTSGLLQSKWSLKGFTITLQETRNIHDSKNRPKIEFIASIYYTIIEFNEVAIRIYLPEKVIIHRGR